MTREEVKLVMATINTIEELEKKIGYIKTSTRIIFENLPMVGTDVHINDGKEIKELKDLATLQIQTKLDKYNDELKQFGLD
mgnify:CR=1 FL=1